MKSLILASLVAMSASAFAWNDDCFTGHTNGQCNDDKYFTCYSQDAQGNTYSQYSNGWLDKTRTQIRVHKKCKAASARPETCHPAKPACVDKY